MRGAHSAGVLEGLSHGKQEFDVVLGSSAGACTVAFWVADQHHMYTRIWGNYLHDDQFIRYRYLVMPGPVMNLDYLLYEVFGRHEPLDIDRIHNSKTDFFITVTHCETGKTHYLHNKNKIDVLEALLAGAAMPLAYPLPVWYQGQPFADGGIAGSIPVQKAIDEGCDEFIIILTRPQGFRKKRVSPLPWPRYLFRKYPGLVESLRQRHHRYNQQLEHVAQLEHEGKAIVIRPPAELPLSRFMRKRSLIHQAIDQGRRDAAAALK